MSIFTIRETFVLSSICQKCQDSQIKEFLCFKLKGGWKREGDCNHKTAFIWEPWNFYMLDKIQVFCMVKTHILSFMTPPLFVRFLRDMLSFSFKMRKKGRGHKKNVCFYLTRNFYFIKHMPKMSGFQVTPSPLPTLNFLETTYPLYAIIN